jgi:hypothetical protein
MVLIKEQLELGVWGFSFETRNNRMCSKHVYNIYTMRNYFQKFEQYLLPF